MVGISNEKLNIWHIPWWCVRWCTIGLGARGDAGCELGGAASCFRTSSASCSSSASKIQPGAGAAAVGGGGNCAAYM